MQHRHTSMLAKATQGATSTAILRLFSTVARFASGIVAARFLDPASFGVFAAVSVFISAVEILSLSGLSTAYVTSKFITSATENAIKTSTWIMAVGGAIILLFLAGRIAVAAGHQEMEQWVRLAAPVMFLKVLSSFSGAKLLRDFEITKVSVIDAASILIGPVIVSTMLAMGGVGAESLFVGYYIQHILCAIALMILRPPGIPRVCSLSLIQTTLAEGFRILFAQAGFQVAQRIDYWIVGRVLGVEQLGVYNRAFVIMEANAGIFTKSIEAVSLPVVSRLPDDMSRRFVLSTSIGITLISLGPIAIWLAFSAHSLIEVLLGPRWQSAAGPLEILAFAIPFRAVCKAPNLLTISVGRTRSFQFLVWGYAVVVAAAAFLGSRFGVIGSSIGGLLATSAYGISSCLLAARYIKMPQRDLLASVCNAIPINVLAAGLAVSFVKIQSRLHISNFMGLSLTVVLFAISMFISIILFPRAFIAKELFLYLRSLPSSFKLAGSFVNNLAVLFPGLTRFFAARWDVP
jgi:PST family polysaccharide transporter